MSVPGAYQKQLSIPWTPDNEKDYGTSFVFHVDKEMRPELQVELEQTISVLQVSIHPDATKLTEVCLYCCFLPTTFLFIYLFKCWTVH